MHDALQQGIEVAVMLILMLLKYPCIFLSVRLSVEYRMLVCLFVCSRCVYVVA